MATHQARSGQFVTSYACKTGDHGQACDTYLAGMTALADGRPPLVCHCDCHPTCPRPECVTARAQGRTTITTI